MNFLVSRTSFDDCLHNLTLVFERCIECNLTLNLEKGHFMVQQSIVLGHVIYSGGIEVDKGKIDLIIKLSPLLQLKEL